MNATQLQGSDSGNQDSGNDGDMNTFKNKLNKLSPYAPEFDAVKISPTINPYGGQYGISTQPVYVPPAQIPSPPPNNLMSASPPGPNHLLSSQPENQSQQPPQPQPQPQSQQQPPQQQQQQGGGGGGQSQQPPSSSLQPPAPITTPQSALAAANYHHHQQQQQQQQLAAMHHANMIHLVPAPVGPPSSNDQSNNIYMTQNQQIAAMQAQQQQQQLQTSNQQGGGGNGPSPSNGYSNLHPTRSQIQFPTIQQQIAPNQSRNKEIQYSKPPPEAIDPSFTNPIEYQGKQKWELLESAKRWLPGEGTFTQWNGYRYVLGKPIHMGMNGHIHYCYRYKIGGNNQEVEQLNKKPPRPEVVAAKVVPNTPAFAREIVILRALQGCENITKLYEVLESERTLISILELAQADVYNFFVGRGARKHGWNLEKPAVREHFARMVVSNVVQGLKQMHEKEYLHCDLKSLNILLYIYSTQGSSKRGGVYMKAKLTDFGHSSHGKVRLAEKLFSNGMARVGTAGHVAPELFKEGARCGSKIDIWSLGIVMFSMLVPGRLLFGEYTNLETLKQGYDRLNNMNPYSRERPSWWTDFERLSPESRDLILWMTRFDPKDRPDEDQILKHPWFTIMKAHKKPGCYRPKLEFVDRLCSSSIAQE